MYERTLEEIAEEEAAGVYLWSPGLFSKFGFGDGDHLFDWKERHVKPGTELNSADLLVAAVEAYLLPALRQKVEVELLATMHNPIRAVTVDGVPVDWDVEEGGLEADAQVEAFGLPPGCYDVSGEVLFKDGKFPEGLCRQRIWVVNPQEPQAQIGEGVNSEAAQGE